MSKILVIDTETSGILNKNEPYTAYISGPQIIQLGAVVSDVKNNYSIIDTFKTNIRYIGKLNYPSITWSDEAQKIHGLTINQLSLAPSPLEAANSFISFLSTYFDLSQKIIIAAHNPEFDSYFIRQLLFFAGLIDKVKINHRMIDTSTLGQIIYGQNGSRELFKICSGLVRDGSHDALEDAIACNAVLIETKKRLKGIL